MMMHEEARQEVVIRRRQVGGSRRQVCRRRERMELTIHVLSKSAVAPLRSKMREKGCNNSKQHVKAAGRPLGGGLVVAAAAAAGATQQVTHRNQRQQQKQPLRAVIAFIHSEATDRFNPAAAAARHCRQ